ncbi:MAG: sigma 54-interacting transcriptional regulator, partial [Bacillota bacterium]
MHQLPNRYWRTVVNSIHDGIIAVDEDGFVRIFNPAAARITGLSPEDVIGQPAAMVIPNTRLHMVLAVGDAELNQQQHLGEATIITNRVPIRSDDGRVIGAVAVFRDISELRQLALEVTNLKEMQSMLEAIINSTQDAISVVDRSGRGLRINPAYTRLTGLTEKDVLGKPATVDIAEGESMHMRVLATGSAVRGVTMKVGPSRREVVVNAAPIMVDGHLKGSVGVVHDISELRRLSDELDKAKKLIRKLEAKYTFDDIIGGSASLLSAIEEAQRAAPTSATVLLRGESGTGKEIFAHSIHNASERRFHQFVRVNCAAIADSLLESELFGYEEGAFTGARRGGKKGLFEEANGGTIFLDEIGEVSLSLQAKLLRVLQEREIVRVGHTKPVSVDVRIIAATNQNLEAAVRKGSFREDLYYRLNVVPILIPALRDRIDDLPALVDHLIHRFNQEYGRSVDRASEDVLRRLMTHSWPGNVRELENFLGRAIFNMRVTDRT